MKKIIFSIAAVLGSYLGLYAGDIPEFPGGKEALKKYISEHTVYPASAKENGIEGVVTVGFLVETDGSLSEIKVMKFVDPDLEKSAVRLVSGMPLWIPAEKDGVPFEAPSSVDIPFILEE